MGQPLRRGVLVLSLLLACAGGKTAGSGATTSTSTTSTTTSTTSTSTSTATSTATSTSTSSSSASTAATDDSVGESSTTEPGCSFLGCEDMGSLCGAPPGTGFITRIQCDFYQQDCPPGQKCAPFSCGGDVLDYSRCVEISPAPKSPGEPCVETDAGDDCDATSMCWDVDEETGTGVCVPFCAGDFKDPICPEGLTCAQANGGALTLCLPSCGPFLQDCPADDTCVPAPGGAVCVPDASGTAGVAGDPCEWLNTCDPGLVCLDADEVEGCAGDPGCCAPLCDLDAPAPCPGAGESCVPWYAPGEAPPGLDHIGVCALP